jgi:hypothetical protein
MQNTSAITIIQLKEFMDNYLYQKVEIIFCWHLLVQLYMSQIPLQQKFNIRILNIIDAQ